MLSASIRPLQRRKGQLSADSLLVSGFVGTLKTVHSSAIPLYDSKLPRCAFYLYRTFIVEFQLQGIVPEFSPNNLTVLFVYIHLTFFECLQILIYLICCTLHFQ